MAKKLEGKVAVVTGASKGIGAEIARQLAAEGAKVVVNYASSKAGADKVVADIGAKGGQAVAVQADVAKEGDVRKLFAEAKKAVVDDGPYDQEHPRRWEAGHDFAMQLPFYGFEHVDLCTSCNPDLFFSHRRDNGVTGRQGGIAWLTG